MCTLELLYGRDEQHQEELAAAVRIQAFNRAHTARATFTKLQVTSTAVHKNYS
jgi:hypothetical protein